MGRKVNLPDLLASLSDRSIEITTADGQVFTIPPPELWPDSITATSDDREDVVTLIGGQERFDAFLAAGGSWRLLQSIINEGYEAPAGE